MYKRILVTVDGTKTDRAIIGHVKELARLAQSHVVLLHVADGWAARNYERFQLRESEEMKQDREYLAALSEELRGEGYEVKAVLAMGDPATEIIKLARAESVDLIAMTTHGHRFVADLLHGSTADKVRHEVDVPVLLLKVRK